MRKQRLKSFLKHTEWEQAKSLFINVVPPTCSDHTSEISFSSSSTKEGLD